MTLPMLISLDCEARLLVEVGRVPQHCQQGVLDYLRYGLPPGHFLSAVLTNDLAEACLGADDVNRTALYDYVYVLYNYAPADAWGTRAKVLDWIEQGMAQRRAATEASA